MRFWLFVLLSLLTVLASQARADSVTMTTYYPSPSGDYDSLRARKICVGTACAAGTASNDQLYVQDKVGIGVNDPSQSLDVGGQVRIRGGAPGDGKVLTSDANGAASWQNATVKLKTYANGDICSPTNTGELEFSAVTGTLVYCNGTAWTGLNYGTPSPVGQ